MQGIKVSIDVSDYTHETQMDVTQCNVEMQGSEVFIDVSDYANEMQGSEDNTILLPPPEHLVHQQQYVSSAKQ